MSLFSHLTVLTAVSLFIVGSTTAIAQEGAGGSSGPEGVPPEIAALLGQAGEGGATTIAPPAVVPDLDAASADASAVGSNYIYNTLRVISNGGTRGCGSSDWTCMANLCKSDLGSSAWRGWAGCWKEGGNFICYFECSQAKSAF
jgi:hypothetical protein